MRLLLEEDAADDRAVVAQVLGQDHRPRGPDEQQRHRQDGDQRDRSALLAQIPVPVVLAPPEPALSSPRMTATGSPSAATRTSLSIGCCFGMPTISEITPAHCLPCCGSYMTTLVLNGESVLPTGVVL